MDDNYDREKLFDELLAQSYHEKAEEDVEIANDFLWLIEQLFECDL